MTTNQRKTLALAPMVVITYVWIAIAFTADAFAIAADFLEDRIVALDQWVQR